MKKKYSIDIDNLFIEVNKAYPIPISFQEEDINFPNSVILPPSALEKLISMEDPGIFNDRYFFRILNINLNIQTLCSSFDFFAEEGTCYISNNLFKNLKLEEGQDVNIRNIKNKDLKALNIQIGNFVLLKPYKAKFLNYPNKESLVKSNLLNYSYLFEGSTISLKMENIFINWMFYNVNLKELL